MMESTGVLNFKFNKGTPLALVAVLAAAALMAEVEIDLVKGDLTTDVKRRDEKDIFCDGGNS